MRVILLISRSTTPAEARRAAATFALGRDLERVDVLAIRLAGETANGLHSEPGDPQLAAIASAVARELAPRGTAVAASTVTGRLRATLGRVARELQSDAVLYVKPRGGLLPAWVAWWRMVRVVRAAPLPIWVV